MLLSAGREPSHKPNNKKRKRGLSVRVGPVPDWPGRDLRLNRGNTDAAQMKGNVAKHGV